MRQKYHEDPLAFLVLWSLFFGAGFLVFAFRGLIAAVFMPKIDVSNELPQSEMTNEINNITSSVDNTADNSTAPSNLINNTSPTDNSADNSTNQVSNEPAANTTE